MSLTFRSFPNEPFVSEWPADFIEPFSQLWSTNVPSATRQARVDLIELPDSFCVYLDAPGTRDEDIGLSVTNGVLDVRIQRKVPSEREEGIQHRAERVFAERHRRLRLPSNVDVDRPIAKLNDGVLTVTFPKLGEPSSMKKIPISNR